MNKFFNSKNEFLFGKYSYEKAILCAKNCKNFTLDSDEDEFVTTTDENSCYNCLFRRWNKESFLCLKLK